MIDSVFVDSVNKILNQTPSVVLTCHVIRSFRGLITPLHEPPHVIKLLATHACFPKIQSRNALATWLVTPQLGTISEFKPCHQHEHSKPLEKFFHCGWFLFGPTQSNVEPLDHPLELCLGEASHETIKLGVLGDKAIVTTFSELIASPLACHPPHLCSHWSIHVMGSITLKPCTAIIGKGSRRWWSRGISSSP